MPEEQPYWKAVIWRTDVRPLVRAAVKDAARAVLFWMVIALAHAVQVITLKFGWSVMAVKRFDRAEEWAVYISLLVLLAQQALAFTVGAITELRGKEDVADSDS